MSGENVLRMGKITQTVWNRSVRKQIKSAAAGTADTGMALAGRCMWADGCASGNGADTAYYAVYHAVGELASLGAQAEGVSVRVMMPPGSTEEYLREIALYAGRACGESGVSVSGFDGEVTGAVRRTVVYASAAGQVREQGKPQALRREILMCGYAGLEGSLRVLAEAQEELAERFVGAFLEQAKTLTEELVTPSQIWKIYEDDPSASVRQIGAGGIMAALWEAAGTERAGFEIDMAQIPVRQETVEICEFYRLNPYLMTSAGSYLILTSEAEHVIRTLGETGVCVRRLGSVRAQNARIIRNGEEIRYLDRPAPDELGRWQERDATGGQTRAAGK